MQKKVNRNNYTVFSKLKMYFLITNIIQKVADCFEILTRFGSKAHAGQFQKSTQVVECIGSYMCCHLNFLLRWVIFDPLGWIGVATSALLGLMPFICHDSVTGSANYSGCAITLLINQM